ncbi:MAG: 2-oxoacid:acceptor oxidoreductase subunit alpha [Nitrospinota bacterium]|nr:MAG: 2-oxoacid:acceptor oxidoreductase subunit alpha [Nitrospinota bacterium]
MRGTEVTVGIGGAAGEGIGSTGDSLARVCARLGLHLCAYNSYQSVIRGGHVWLRLRIADEKIYSHGDHLNILLALNQDTLNRHTAEVRQGGILFNADRLQVPQDDLQPGVELFPFPVKALTEKYGRHPVMQNTLLLGGLLWLLDLEFEVLAGILREMFQRKGDKVVEANVGIARAGYEYAQQHYPKLNYAWRFSGKRRMVVSGNEMFGLGAIVAGCKFYSAYPMTPASSILHYLARHGPAYGMVVKQAEDEIAVINMAIGAGHVGVRAMCGTSGGGFALMTEAVGLAGMTETPVVIIEAQRGGPSTGLPTKTEQGDLHQMFGASQGEYPRAIIAPTDVVDCYYTVIEAFNLAEKYQCPVIIASDLYLSEHRETADPEEFRFDVPIERGELITDGVPENYKRYAITPSGISPRVLPGNHGTAYVAASDEHDEDGILLSDVFTDPVKRKRMMEKRMRKVEGMRQELPPPQLEGPADAEVTLIGWGSTKGVIRDAITLLAKDGIRANHLQIKYLVPFHAQEVEAILKQCRRTVVVENNYTGQLARHIRAETGIAVDEKILKYDGEPFEPHHIVERVKEVVHVHSR